MPQYNSNQEVPLDSIIVRSQVRQHFDEAQIAGMAVTIKQHGIGQPLSVYTEAGRLVLIAGERRLRAAQKSELKTVPVRVISGPLSEAQILEIQLVENLQRSDLLPLEKAAGIDRLMKASGASAQAVAIKLGLSNGSVTKLLSLLMLPKPIQDGVQAGKIGLTAAYELSRIDNPERQAELASRIVSGQLTRDDVSQSVKASKRPAGPLDGKTVNRAVINLGSGRCVTVAGQGLSFDTLISWLDELVNKAKKARAQRLEFKTFIKVLRDQAKLEPAGG